MKINLEKCYYVYIYLDPRKAGRWEYDGTVFEYEPFYIGCGLARRYKDHLLPSVLKRKNHKSNLINKIIKETGCPPIHYILFDKLTFQESRDIEIKMIAYFGRLNAKTGILVNKTLGGEGVLGIKYGKKPEGWVDPKKGKYTTASKRVNQLNQTREFIKKMGCRF